jgi:hypothetical protein
MCLRVNARDFQRALQRARERFASQVPLDQNVPRLVITALGVFTWKRPASSA